MQPEVPVPDYEKAGRIIAEFNRGHAINNIDYADALEYAEIYLSLTADDLDAMSSDDKAQRDATVGLLGDEIEKEYPYNAELVQILYQAAALERPKVALSH